MKNFQFVLTLDLAAVAFNTVFFGRTSFKLNLIKVYLQIKLVSRMNLQRGLNTWLTQIPVIIRIVIVKHFNELWYIHIIIIIEMAKPPKNKI